ncbi:hypothetical protein N0M98_31990 [Paenibacillus doosanensis]|uniref:hypothetical protein n=1 Tax=Paenibacillus doosanensis TaxID=1229154 RepID=UPI002180416E|nr:hypothetical protein [Paenibacillus doosanensis]MCS7464721.1 hypothetical protein [Paenibacillus doosanensis]
MSSWRIILVALGKGAERHLQPVHTRGGGRASRPHLLTVGAMAAMAAVIDLIVHQALGHGLAALLLDAGPLRLTGLDAAYASDGLAPAARRTLAAAGAAANIAFGLAVMLVQRAYRPKRPHVRYGFWLLGHTNMYMAGGCMTAFAFAQRGDVGAFLSGLEPPLLLMARAGFAALGLAVCLSALLHGARTLEPFAAGSRAAVRRTAVRLAVLPYAVIAAMALLGGALHGAGGGLAEQAAYSLWASQWYLLLTPLAVRPAEEKRPLVPGRSAPLIAMGIAAAIAYIVFLAPGLPF